jgi:hypothetical protein
VIFEVVQDILDLHLIIFVVKSVFLKLNRSILEVKSKCPGLILVFLKQFWI